MLKTICCLIFARGYYGICTLYRSRGKQRQLISHRLTPLTPCPICLTVVKCLIRYHREHQCTCAHTTSMIVGYDPGTFMGCHLNFSKSYLFPLQASSCQQKFIFSCQASFLSASLLSGVLLILCTAICFNCCDKVNGLINVCV